jgi:1-acyl-sn-glycerol-3-phosphate acyltransferase
MRIIGGLIYLLAQAILTPLAVGMMLLTRPFGLKGPRYFSGAWCRVMLNLGRLLFGIRWQVKGWENLPEGPCVVLVKHQSAWETMFFPGYFPPHAFVLKKEVLSLPFFGQGMATLLPIAIDRSRPREALKQVREQGMDRLARGLKVIVFPEGTRVPWGYRGVYNPGGASLASAAKVPVVPMVHNAGQFWQKGAFQKRPGTITLELGPAMDTAGLSTSEINQRAEEWIEHRLEAMSGQVALPTQKKPAAAAAAVSGSQRRHRLEIEGQAVEYAVVRRARRKNIGLLVNPSGLTVSVPTWVPLAAVEQAIRDQWPWVQKKLQHWKQWSVPEGHLFRDGDLLPYLGQQHPLQYATAQLSLLVPAQEPIEVDPNRGPVAEQVVHWYRLRALPLFRERVEHFARMLDVPNPKVYLTNARGRWGSCNSAGEIRLSWRLLKASREEIDYVVAHEVAHLRHMNHGDDFWQQVEALMPHYREAQKKLKAADPYYRQF